MIHIRPVSDLRNKFSEIEKIVSQGQPVFLTKNGYGNMVVMNLQQYSKLNSFRKNVDAKLAEVKEHENEEGTWLSEDEVFDDLMRKFDEEV